MGPVKYTFLPIAALLEELALQGMTISPDLHVRLGRYLSIHGPRAHNASGWKHRLGALLCREQSQQELFGEVFDRIWMAWTATQPEAEAENPVPSPTPADQHPNEGGTADKPTTVLPPRREAAPARPTAGRSGPTRWSLQFGPNPARFWNTSIIDRAMPAWREKEWTPVLDWDIAGSIQATIRAGGMPTLVSRPRRTTPQYLVLIEEWTPRDHVAGLYADLCAEWRVRDLTVEWFYYDNSPARCWRDRREPSSYTYLERLMNEYEGYKLLLVGEPESLLDMPELRPSDIVLDALQTFRNCALLCTRSTAEWGQPERALAQVMPVAPATPEGIASLPWQWAEGRNLPPAYWTAALPEPTVPTLERDDEDHQHLMADLKAYLGRHAYAWLCASSVYPELYYELTALLNDESIAPNPKLAEWDQNRIWLNALIRLTRLPWFRRGAIPRELRAQLRTALPPDQARAVRRQLLEVLGRQVEPPSGSYAAADRVFTELWLEHETALAAVSSEEERAILTEAFRAQMGSVSPADVEDALGRSYLQTLAADTTDQPPAYRILWVNDTPEQNEGMRRFMTERYGVIFQLVLNTDSALRQLQLLPYDLAVTDFSRTGDYRAAERLIRNLPYARQTPVIVFTSKRNRELEESNLLSTGATAVFDEGDQLMEWIKNAAREKLGDYFPRSGVEWSESLMDNTRYVVLALAQRSRNYDLRQLVELSGLEEIQYDTLLSELEEVWMRKYVDDSRIDELADQLLQRLFGLPAVGDAFPEALGALRQTLNEPPAEGAEPEAGAEPETEEPQNIKFQAQGMSYQDAGAEPETEEPQSGAQEAAMEAPVEIPTDWPSWFDDAGIFLQSLGSPQFGDDQRAMAQSIHNTLREATDNPDSVGLPEAARADEGFFDALNRAVHYSQSLVFLLNTRRGGAAQELPDAARQLYEALADAKAVFLNLIAEPTIRVSIAWVSSGRPAARSNDRLRLEEALNSITDLALTSVQPASISELQAQLAATPADVLHFAVDSSPPSAPSKAQAIRPIPPGIYFADRSGGWVMAAPGELASALSANRGLKAVLLYDCYQEEQARAISRALPESYIIGVRTLPRDESPLAFAREFYLQLSIGVGVLSAIDAGQAQLLAYNEPEDRLFVWLGGERQELGPSLA